MSPNAVRALQWLGAWEAVEPHCVSPPKSMCAMASPAISCSASAWASLRRAFGAPYRVAHRADLLDGLLAGASKARHRIASTAEVTDASIAETPLTLKSGRSAQRRSHHRRRWRAFGSENVWPGQPGKNPIGHIFTGASFPCVRAADRGCRCRDALALSRRPCGALCGQQLAALQHRCGRGDPGISLWHRISGRLPAARRLLEQKIRWTEMARPSILLPCGTGAGTGRCSSAMPPTPPCPISPKVPPWPLKMPACLPVQYETPGLRSAFADSPISRYRAPAQSKNDRANSAESIMPGRPETARNLALKTTPRRSFLKQLSWIYDWKT